MDEHNESGRQKALEAIASMAARSEKAQRKLAPGTAQHTLLQNRIAALHVAAAMIGQQPAGHSREQLERARAPIASLISKSEKAQAKLAAGSWQHTMLQDNLRALRMATPLLEMALSEQEGET